MFKHLLVIICVIAIIIVSILGGWWLKRTINYKLFYQSQVEETVRKMVKPEYLK